MARREQEGCRTVLRAHPGRPQGVAPPAAQAGRCRFDRHARGHAGASVTLAARLGSTRYRGGFEASRRPRTDVQPPDTMNSIILPLLLLLPLHPGPPEARVLLEARDGSLTERRLIEFETLDLRDVGAAWVRFADAQPWVRTQASVRLVGGGDADQGVSIV